MSRLTIAGAAHASTVMLFVERGMQFDHGGAALNTTTTELHRTAVAVNAIVRP